MFMQMIRKNNTKRKYRRKQTIKILEYAHKKTCKIKTAAEALENENIINVFEHAVNSYAYGPGFTYKVV